MKYKSRTKELILILKKDRDKIYLAKLTFLNESELNHPSFSYSYLHVVIAIEGLGTDWTKELCGSKQNL